MPNFLEDYKTYTEPLESPEIFQVWCALVALSAAAQRKVWLDYDGLFQVSPNIYVCLVSPPGMCSKDTAMNKVRDLLDPISTIKTKSDSITKEKIFAYMSEITTQFPLENHKLRAIVHSSLTIFASEMSMLLKHGDRDFVSALNNLYNTQPTFRHSTKHNSESIVIKPYLTILAGTTPDWMRVNIQEDFLEGGLSSRLVPVFSDTPKPPNPRPQVSPEGRAALGRLVSRLETITQIGGEFRITEDTWPYYSAWYKDHHSKTPKNPILGPYWWRKRTHLLKLSMLVSLASRDDLLIKREDIDQALAILELTEPVIERAYQGVGRNLLSSMAQNVLDQIIRAGKIKLSELYELNYHQINDKELKEILQVLTNMGKVRLEIAGSEPLVVSKVLRLKG